MLRWILIFIIVGVVVYHSVKLFLPWEKRRALEHRTMYVLGIVGALTAIVPLMLLLFHLVRAGLPGLNLAFFAQVEKPDGVIGGGFANAIVGSVIIVAIAGLIGVPIGILSGIYLAEIGRGKGVAVIRFLAEVLTGLPSIIAGILGYTLIVIRTGHNSGIAASLALSFLMIPVVARVTEEAIRLVPKHLSEASYGLGVGQWRTIWHVVLPSARSGILTGVVLAIARAAGETAPLIFTALGTHDLVLNPNQTMSALPLAIYQNNGSPSSVNQQLAVTGALVLVILIGAVTALFRWFSARTQPGMG